MVYTAVNYGTEMGDCGPYHMVNGDDDTNGRHHDDEKNDDDNVVDVQSMQSDGTTECPSCGKD